MPSDPPLVKDLSDTMYHTWNVIVQLLMGESIDLCFRCLGADYNSRPSANSHTTRGGQSVQGTFCHLTDQRNLGIEESVTDISM